MKQKVCNLVREGKPAFVWGIGTLKEDDAAPTSRHQAATQATGCAINAIGSAALLEPGLYPLQGKSRHEDHRYRERQGHRLHQVAWLRRGSASLAPEPVR
jgi:hypothetical protein